MGRSAESVQASRRASKRSTDGLHPKAERILTVALDLFSRRDFLSVTNKDIASAANINSALIYYYFENKEHLFRSVIGFATQRAMETYRKLEAQHSHPAYLIQLWFDNNITLSEPIRQLIKIMLDYRTGDNAVPIDDLVSDFYHHEEEEILAQNIRKGVRMKLFAKNDVTQTARFVSVHLDGIMAASLVRKDFDLAASVRELAHHLWDRLEFDPALIPRSGQIER